MAKWNIDVDNGEMPFANIAGKCSFSRTKDTVYEEEKDYTKSNQSEGPLYEILSCQKQLGDLWENLKVFLKTLRFGTRPGGCQSLLHYDRFPSIK